MFNFLLEALTSTVVLLALALLLMPPYGGWLAWWRGRPRRRTKV